MGRGKNNDQITRFVAEYSSFYQTFELWLYVQPPVTKNSLVTVQSLLNATARCLAGWCLSDTHVHYWGMFSIMDNTDV